MNVNIQNDLRNQNTIHTQLQIPNLINGTNYREFNINNTMVINGTNSSLLRGVNAGVASKLLNNDVILSQYYVSTYCLYLSAGGIPTTTQTSEGIEYTYSWRKSTDHYLSPVFDSGILTLENVIAPLISSSCIANTLKSMNYIPTKRFPEIYNDYNKA